MRCHVPGCRTRLPKGNAAIISTSGNIGTPIGGFFVVPGTLPGTSYVGGNTPVAFPPFAVPPTYLLRSPFFAPGKTLSNLYFRNVSSSFVGPVTVKVEKNNIPFTSLTFPSGIPPGLHPFPVASASFAFGDTFAFSVTVPGGEPGAAVVGQFSGLAKSLLGGSFMAACGFTVGGLGGTRFSGVPSYQPDFFPTATVESEHAIVMPDSGVINTIQIDVNRYFGIAPGTIVTIRKNFVDVASVVLAGTGTVSIPASFGYVTGDIITFRWDIPPGPGNILAVTSFKTKAGAAANGGLFMTLMPVVAGSNYRTLPGSGSAHGASSTTDLETRGTVPITAPTVLTAWVNVKFNPFPGGASVNIAVNGVDTLIGGIPPLTTGTFFLGGLPVSPGDQVNVHTIAFDPGQLDAVLTAQLG